MPAPGVPETHPLFAAAAAAGRPVRSEIELAYRWEQERPGGPRPMLAVTGTDGKTTTTLLAVGDARRRAVCRRWRPATPRCRWWPRSTSTSTRSSSSARASAWPATARFRGEAAVWLNLAPDHLNWHASMDTYEAAKARLFDHQRPGDVAIGFADDPVVMRHLRAAPGRQRTFGLAGADYRVEDGALVGPAGALGAVATLRRTLPHDLTNGLAAASLVLEAGLAGRDAVAAGLASFAARRTASSSSARAAASAGTTTPRRPRRTRRRRPSAPSTTSC